MIAYLQRLWQFVANSIAGGVLCPNFLRCLLYRNLGINTSSSKFGPNIMFYSSKISIGKNSLINRECYIHNYSHITIGDNCFLAPQVMLCTISHEIGLADKRAGEFKTEPINIGNGSWIGARATILPGVTIGEGCIIAAGAVVTKDCEPNGLYAGVPARRIKDLPIDDKLKEVI